MFDSDCVVASGKGEVSVVLGLAAIDSWVEELGEAAGSSADVHPRSESVMTAAIGTVINRERDMVQLYDDLSAHLPTIGLKMVNI